jgi:tetratricopeptide (TPR) repeat protein
MSGSKNVKTAKFSISALFIAVLISCAAYFPAQAQAFKYLCADRFYCRDKNSFKFFCGHYKNCFKLGEEEKKRGNYLLAIQYYEHALLYAIENNIGDNKIANVYKNIGITSNFIADYDYALINYTVAIKLSPNYAEAYNKRGITYQTKGDIDRAIQDYDKAIELNSNYAEAHNDRGVAYKNKGDYDRAIKDYDAAIDLDSTFINAYFNRGVIYSLKGDCDAAIKDFSKAIELDPKDDEVVYNLALCNERIGNNSEAVKNYRRYIELKPDADDKDGILKTIDELSKNIVRRKSKDNIKEFLK